MVNFHLFNLPHPHFFTKRWSVPIIYPEESIWRELSIISGRIRLIKRITHNHISHIPTNTSIVIAKILINHLKYLKYSLSDKSGYKPRIADGVRAKTAPKIA